MCRNVVVHALERFRGTLDRSNPFSARSIRHTRHRRHSLERGRELVTSSNVDSGPVRSVLGVGTDVVALVQFPVKSGECSLLHWVTYDRAVLEQDESVGGGEGEGGLAASLGNGDELLGIGGAGVSDLAHAGTRHSLHADNPLNNQVLARNGTGLVEATHVDSASERDSERLRAEDGWT